MAQKANSGSTGLKKHLSKLAQSAWQYPVSVSRYNSPWVWLVSHTMWMKKIGFAAAIPADHPLLQLRAHIDRILYEHASLLNHAAAVHAVEPLPSYLIRAMVLQVVYSIESARSLHEQISYNLLFRRFVGEENEHPECEPFVNGISSFLQNDDILKLIERLLRNAPLEPIAADVGIVVDCALLQTWLAACRAAAPQADA